jgi:hypothetical protein
MYNLSRLAYAFRFMLIGWEHPIASFILGWRIRGAIHEAAQKAADERAEKDVAAWLRE